MAGCEACVHCQSGHVCGDIIAQSNQMSVFNSAHERMHRIICIIYAQSCDCHVQIAFLFAFCIFDASLRRFFSNNCQMCTGLCTGFEVRSSKMAGGCGVLMLSLVKTSFDVRSRWCNSQTTNRCSDRCNTNRSRYLLNMKVSNCYTAVRDVQNRTRMYVRGGTFYFFSLH